MPATIRQGRFEAAIKELTVRVEAPANAGEMLAAQYWRAHAYGALGDRAHAIADLSAALAQAELAGAQPAALAALSGMLGSQLAQTGALAQSRAQLERALQYAERAGDPLLQASALNALGDLLRREGKADEARAFIIRALDVAERSRLPAQAARAAANLLRLPGAAQDAQSRLELARRAARAAEAMEDSHDKAFLLIHVAGLLAGPAGEPSPPGQTIEAVSLLQKARAVAESIGDQRALSHAYGQLGALYERAGRSDDALYYSRQAIFAAQLADAPDSLYRWQWQSARLLAAGGRLDPALDGYRRAQATLLRIRPDLVAEVRASGASYRDTVGPLYLESADLLLRRARASAEATLAQKDLLEARESIEQLKAIELEDYFQDVCVTQLLARQKSIDRIAPRTAVLYPVILPDRVEMLVTLPSGMRQVALPVSGPQLAQEALALRRLLEKRSTFEFLPRAQQLYRWLLRPIEPLLAAEAVDTVVFVPDGPLRNIPLAALHDGKSYLVERYALATAPSLRLIEPRALAPQSARLLLNGLTVPVQSFPALPNVAAEVRAIRELMPGKVLQDGDFSASNFEHELRSAPYSVVHIASHGQFDGDPKKSFLLTYDGKLDMNGLEKVMKLSRFRDEPVELLTLSACRTAAGDERAALGLAGIAIKAGARSALATLWYINDQASSQLVSDFYRQLSEPDTSKARALQRAQQAMLRDARYRHPGYWSPFLLIGNWL